MSRKRQACRGAANDGLTLGERSWACPNCGAAPDRDGSLADNLRRLGLLATNDAPVPDDLRALGRWIADARVDGAPARGP